MTKWLACWLVLLCAYLPQSAFAEHFIAEDPPLEAIPAKPGKPTARHLPSPQKKQARKAQPSAGKKHQAAAKQPQKIVKQSRPAQSARQHTQASAGKNQRSPTAATISPSAAHSPQPLQAAPAVHVPEVTPPLDDQRRGETVRNWHRANPGFMDECRALSSRYAQLDQLFAQQNAEAQLVKQRMAIGLKQEAQALAHKYQAPSGTDCDVTRLYPPGP